MQEQSLQQSLFKVFPIEQEKTRFKDILYDFVEIYPNVGYPLLLFNREKTVEKLREIKRKLLEVGV